MPPTGERLATLEAEMRLTRATVEEIRATQLEIRDAVKAGQTAVSMAKGLGPVLRACWPPVSAGAAYVLLHFGLPRV